MKKNALCSYLFIFLLIFVVSSRTYSQSVNFMYVPDEPESTLTLEALIPSWYQLNSGKIVTSEHGRMLLATDNGIVVSTDKGMSRLNENEDGIDNLSNRRINFIKKYNNVLYAGTDNGIFTSTNEGKKWEQSLTSKNVSCIEVNNNIIYAGTNRGINPGVYKYVNNSWEYTTLKIPTHCLLQEGTTLYAGTDNGLIKTRDCGNSWSGILFSYSHKVTSIVIDGHRIYIGTNNNGCLLSEKDNNFRAINSNFPKRGLGDFHKINSLFSHNNHLYAVTDNGLYLTKINNSNGIAWSESLDKDIKTVSIKLSDDNPILLDSVPCKREDLLFEYSGKGSGTAEDPYQITNVHQLQEVILDIHGDRYWVLMNDIDASETRYWRPRYDVTKKDTVYNGFSRLVGSHFRSLDGRGFKVKNLFMSVMNASLFYGMNCLTLRRIGFENLTVVSYDDYSIGRTGHIDRDILIEECYFDINLSSYDSTYIYGHFNWVVGFIRQTEVKNSYIQWNVNIASGDTMLPFILSSAESNVENCYVTGTINGINIASPFGYEGEIKSCFWDADRIKVDDKRIGKGLGLSTEDMKKRYTYESAGWDFENVWYIDEGKDYPKLRAFKRDTTSVEDLSASDIVLSPNPATNYIEVTLSNHTLKGVIERVRVFNVLGVCVITSPPAPLLRGEGSKVRLDVSHLPPGVYFVQSGSHVQRFVKM